MRNPMTSGSWFLELFSSLFLVFLCIISPSPSASPYPVEFWWLLHLDEMPFGGLQTQHNSGVGARRTQNVEHGTTATQTLRRIGDHSWRGRIREGEQVILESVKHSTGVNANTRTIHRSCPSVTDVKKTRKRTPNA